MSGPPRVSTVWPVDDPDSWRWFWLAAMVFFAISEIAVPGTFFMISFAIGALVACILAFADVGVGAEWAAFVVVSAVALLALVPIGRRINSRPGITGVGATRLNGRRALVLQEIPAGPHATGRVRVEREEWRAESFDGSAVEAGTTVQVLHVDGTRLIVAPYEPEGDV
jgi:membrane protein implicated in regulation of membrane protease activity